MQFKSNIKSKKQKLSEKKFSKGNAPVAIDLIESSQQQPVEVIEKRSKYSGKSINGNYSREQSRSSGNILNLDKIRNAVIQNSNLASKVISQPKKQKEEVDDGLLVVETADQQEPQLQAGDRSLFSYRVQGKQGLKYISQNHFKGRINSEIRDMEYKQKKRLQKQHMELERILEGSFISDDSKKVEKNKKQAENQPEKNEHQRKRTARYFEEQISDEDDDRAEMIKCFRCFKKGHIAKNCIEEERKMQCNFCLKEHYHSQCDSSPCFRCCQSGHISQDCSSKAIECRKCKKRGHRSQKCGVYLPLDYHNKDQEYIKNRFKKSDLKKLKCISFCDKPDGHFNCFMYNSGKQVQPYATVSQKKYVKQRYDQKFYRR